MAILTAKKFVLLLAIYYPCISVMSTVSCKLQEFPVVFAYFHCGILPLILAGQTFYFKEHSLQLYV